MKASDLLLLAALLLAPFAFALTPPGPALTSGFLPIALLLVPLLIGGLFARAAAPIPNAVLAAGLLALLRGVEVPLSVEPGIGLLSASRAVLAAVAAWGASRMTQAGRARLVRAWPLLVAGMLAWGLLQRFVEFPALASLVEGAAAGRIGSGRAFGPFAFPAMLSAFFAGSAALFLSSGRRGWAITAMAALLLPLSLSGPAALVALLVASKADRRWGIAAAIAVGVVLLLRGAEMSDPSSPFALRAALWRGALACASEAPLLGSGTGAFLSIYPAHALGSAPLTSDPHQRLLLLLAENGPLGVALYLCALSPFLRARTPFGRFGLVLAIVSQIDLVEMDAGITTLLFAASGMEAAGGPETALPAAPSRPRALASASFAVLGAAAFLALLPLARAEEAWGHPTGLAPRLARAEISDWEIPTTARNGLLETLRWDADRRAALARILSQHGSGGDVAEPLWHGAVALAPRRARIRASYARFLAAQGRLSHARAEIARARTDAPGDPYVRMIEEEIH